MFSTHSPCKACSKLIINKGGFKHVYYNEKYRLTDGIELLVQCGIGVTQLDNG
jgi:deoxycytidylate deaminase